MAPDTGVLCAELSNACYLVRYCPRPHQRELRAKAILRLGLTVRHAFNASDDFEALLASLVTGLSAKDERLPF